jgi:hypothetical protein
MLCLCTGSIISILRIDKLTHSPRCRSRCLDAHWKSTPGTQTTPDAMCTEHCPLWTLLYVLRLSKLSPCNVKRKPVWNYLVNYLGVHVCSGATS